MSIQFISIIESERFKDRKFARLMLNIIILTIVLTVMSLEVLTKYNLQNVFNDIHNNIIIFTTLCYVSALYAYGYKLPLFKHPWQIFFILCLTLAQAAYVLGYLIYTQYEERSTLYLVFYFSFWSLFYCYITYTINNLKKTLNNDV